MMTPHDDGPLDGSQVKEDPQANPQPEDLAPRIATSDTEPTTSDGSSKPATDKDPQLQSDEDLDEEARLSRLVTTRDQDDLERDISRQADQLLKDQADERDQKRYNKTDETKRRIQSQVQDLDKRIDQTRDLLAKQRFRAERDNLQAKLNHLDAELVQIQQRIEDRHNNEDNGETLLEEKGSNRLPNESQRDFLIRTGKITPFSKMPGLPKTSTILADVMMDAEQEDDEEGVEDAHQAAGPKSHVNLSKPGFQDEASEPSSALEDTASTTERTKKRRRLQTRREHEASRSASPKDSDDAYDPGLNDQELAAIGESDDVDEEGYASDDFVLDTPAPRKRKAAGKKVSEKALATEPEQEDLTGLDDGDEDLYQRRLQNWIVRRSDARRKARAKYANEDQHPAWTEERGGEPEWCQPHPTISDTEFEDGLRIPGDIYPSLFDYQKTGVLWLSELYSQQTGGIVGDEMGLGKTIQVIAFLACLHYSKQLKGPCVVVCPATIMTNWVNEFHRWWPALRVSILHSSGSGMLDVGREDRMERDLELDDYGVVGRKPAKGQKAAQRIVDRVVRDGHVLVTTYTGLQSYARQLLSVEWEYAVLDEGHKIRNPNAAITMHCKNLLTPNRIILSGTPIQNNLTDLWSLFDFVFPMRLGSLVTFKEQFEFPIKHGGYANASNLQVETAMKCAETLKEVISPYLLQRFKSDVAADLPKKTERVLFCKLTSLQRQAYQDFLASDEMNAINDGRRQALYGVDILRKICNHPDLVDHKRSSHKLEYGTPSKSGKMQVVKDLLSIWKRGGHKTLLFAQHRIMLDILEKYINQIGNINYRRMDGNTSIKNRQGLVDEFNNDPDIHVFLLTTKVGGLGVNLTGADRVLIYDPDWNPSTDIQARERAWRLGQSRAVEIYRLMTAGTIEEKIYHRQIFKQFLTNKILRDPKQRQTFQLRDLHDLFTLGDTSPTGQTETGSIFRGTEVRFSDKDKNRTVNRHGLPTPPNDYPTHNSQIGPGENINTISGIAAQEDYRTAEGESRSQGADNAQESNSDDRLLSSIFSRAGVHSALEHDAILASNTSRQKVQADPAMVKAEAKRFAANARRELERAGEVARTVPAGVPTWTGMYGETGREEERPSARDLIAARGRGGGRGGGGVGRGGPSSSSVLANLSARQGGASGGAGLSSASASSSRASTPLAGRRNAAQPSERDKPSGKDLMLMIRDFFIAHGGRAYTRMLIDHFSHVCDGSERRTAQFEGLVRELAVMEKLGRGEGRAKWILRDEYWPRGQRPVEANASSGTPAPRGSTRGRLRGSARRR